MRPLNMDSLRAAALGTRESRFTAASDLVKRTLAQHGIGSTVDAGVPGTALPPMPDMSSMNGQLAGINSLLNNTAPTRHVSIPDGAEFRQETYTCNAGSRTYRLYRPSTATATNVSGIVVMLHGCTQNPEDFAIGTGMNELAEKHRFVVVYPQQSRGDNAQSCWNWFSRADQKRGRGEPAILAGLTRQVMTKFSVPSDRTFVAGLSAGAAMAVILGETYADTFSAVGAHSGLPFGSARDVASAFAAMAGNTAQTTQSDTSTSAIRTIVFHGSADTTVHPSNGEHIARGAMDKGAQQTIETTEQGSSAGKRFHRRIVTTEAGVTQLEQWSIDGLGHAWSGGQSAGSYTDSQGPDASAEMIRFFFEVSRD